MSLIDDLVEELRTDHGVQSSKNRGGAWTLNLVAPPGFSTEVVIAPEVLEWFVAVFDADGAKVWSDWFDYLGYKKDEDPTEELAAMMSDIKRFVKTMSEVEDFRVSTLPVFRMFGFTLGRIKVAEWLRGGEWHSVTPFC